MWLLEAIWILAVVSSLVSCGDEHGAYTISGAVGGLAGSGLVIQNNSRDDISISANGNFTFQTRLLDGGQYIVTIKTQPTNPSQTCAVTNGTGTVYGPVNNVSITCTTNRYTVGGTISGVAGTGLVLQNNSGDDLSVTSNGNFTFATNVSSNSAYNITVKTHPSNPWQTCTVSGGSGTVTNAAVTGVAVTCTTNRYTVGGSVSGLSGSGLALQNNGGDNLSISSTGSFTFTTPVASNGAYNVTVSTHPTGPSQTCAVAGGSGTVLNGDITTVAVTCTTNTYRVGGTVTGLDGNGLVLQNNAGDDLGVSANGTFQFATPVASGTAYDVAVKTLPRMLSQRCSISNGNGTMVDSDVTDVAVNCVTPTPRYVLVVRAFSSSLTVFEIDPGTGALTQRTSITLPYTPMFIAMHPSMRFAYIANINNNLVSAYEVDQVSGVLTQIAGSPYATGAGPSYISFDPTGRYAYVSNSNAGTVSVFAVDENTGALAPIPGSPFAGGRAFQVVPSGRFGYSEWTLRTDGFTVDSTTGAFSPLNSTPALGGNNNFAMDPAGRFLYIPYYDSSAGTTYIGGFAIDASTGTLTQVPQGIIVAGAGVDWAAVDPRGKFLYAVGLWSRTVISYTVNQQTGDLTNIDTDGTEPSPNFVVVDPSGRFVYVANDWGSISAFSIDGTTGQLTPIAAPYRLPSFGMYGSMAIAVVTD